MVYQRKVSPEMQIARAWSAGYLSAKGYIGISHGVAYMEIKARDAWEELNRFVVPISDLRYSLTMAQYKGNEVAALYVRGDNLRQMIERLRPYLTYERIERYEVVMKKVAMEAFFRPLDEEQDVKRTA